MVVGQRIEQLLEQRHLKQSELARRVGVDQSTINALVRGGSRSSRHLHRIARELGTTPAYLTGETTDPTGDVPEDTHTADERMWVDFWRSLDTKQRRALVTVIESMLRRSPEPALHKQGGSSMRDET